MSFRILPITFAGLWKGLLLFLALAINIALAYHLLLDPRSLFHSWNSLKERQNSLTSRLESLDQRRAALSREIRLLKTDPAYVEKMIRQRLNYVRENEILYLFDKKRQDDSVSSKSESESTHE